MKRNRKESCALQNGRKCNNRFDINIDTIQYLYLHRNVLKNQKVEKISHVQTHVQFNGHSTRRGPPRIAKRVRDAHGVRDRG